MKKQRAFLLYGGGFDSTYLLLTLKEEYDLECFHYDYGQVTAPGEQRSCDYFCSKYGIPLHNVRLGGMVYDARNPIVNYRNPIFMLHAAHIASRLGIDLGFVGFILEPGISTDSSNHTLHLVNSTLEHTHNPKASYEGKACVKVRYRAPLINTSKQFILNRSIAIDPDTLEYVFTCQRSHTLEHCGECGHCLARIELMRRK